MRCPECSHENPAAAKFCMECGAKLENICPQCGAKLPSEAKFCMECGAKLAEAAPTSTEAVVPKLEDIQDSDIYPGAAQEAAPARGERVTLLCGGLAQRFRN